jgi:hypothetical protein
MLLFAHTPDKVFSEILVESIESAIHDSTPNVFKENPGDSFYFDPDDIKKYGGGVAGINNLISELEMLLNKHSAEEDYLPSEEHFRILYRVLAVFCIAYTKFYAEEESEEYFKYLRDSKGQIIKKLDINMIRDIFFWSKDFNLSDEALSAINNELDSFVGPDFLEDYLEIIGFDLGKVEEGFSYEDIPWNNKPEEL